MRSLFAVEDSATPSANSRPSSVQAKQSTSKPIAWVRVPKSSNTIWGHLADLACRWCSSFQEAGSVRYLEMPLSHERQFCNVLYIQTSTHRYSDYSATSWRQHSNVSCIQNFLVGAIGMWFVVFVKLTCYSYCTVYHLYQFYHVLWVISRYTWTFM